MTRPDRADAERTFTLDGEYVAAQARAALVEMFAPVTATFRFAERLTRPKSLASQLADYRVRTQRAKPQG